MELSGTADPIRIHDRGIINRKPDGECVSAAADGAHSTLVNKIEHRLFSHIAMNWRGKPLVSLATIVSLIGATTTEAGLRVRSEIDKRSYPKGVTVKDEQLARVQLCRHDFHGDWNYTIQPTAAQ